MDDTEKRPAFKVGDVVTLRGGNARMTVEALEDGKVYCVWLHEGTVSREWFDLPVLWNSTLNDERVNEQYRAAYEKLRAERAEAASKDKSDHIYAYLPRFTF